MTFKGVHLQEHSCTETNTESATLYVRPSTKWQRETKKRIVPKFLAPARHVSF